MADKYEKDKSWGTIGFSRCYGNGGIELFGSDIKNNTYIELTIKHAQKCRSLGQTYQNIRKDKMYFSDFLFWIDFVKEMMPIVDEINSEVKDE